MVRSLGHGICSGCDRWGIAGLYLAGEVPRLQHMLCTEPLDKLHHVPDTALITLPSTQSPHQLGPDAVQPRTLK